MADTPMAVCPHDGAPLICTFAWPKKEWYCLECGAHLGWVWPATAQATPELQARYDQLKAEWDEHVAPRLRVCRWWLGDCSKCRPGGEYHDAHATPEERQAHQDALDWLAQRVRQGAAA